MSLKKTMEDVRDLGVDDVLAALGLERQRSGAARYAVPALALLGAAAVGCVVGLLLAPSSGSELRARVREQLQRRGNGLFTEGEDQAAGA
jgi:hypothetical protein